MGLLYSFALQTVCDFVIFIWAICTKQRACVAHVQHVYSLFSLDHVVAITCILELSPGRILLLFPTTCADVGCDV